LRSTAIEERFALGKKLASNYLRVGDQHPGFWLIELSAQREGKKEDCNVIRKRIGRTREVTCLKSVTITAEKGSGSIS
jgi:hypothetical protein